MPSIFYLGAGLLNFDPYPCSTSALTQGVVSSVLYYFWLSNCIYLSSRLRSLEIALLLSFTSLGRTPFFSKLESKQPVGGLSFPNQMFVPWYALIWNDFNWGNKQGKCHPSQSGSMFYECILEGRCLVCLDKVWSEARGSDSATEMRSSNLYGNGVRRNEPKIVGWRAEQGVQVLTQEPEVGQMTAWTKQSSFRTINRER